MKQQLYQFSYTIINDISLLKKEDAALLQQARELTQSAYAPYSNFRVACVAKLANEAIAIGTNQENASYPVGICAERALLATVGSQYPGVAIQTMAVTYQSKNNKSDKPITPCGMCRQALAEYEERTKHPVRLILSGMEGEIYIIESSKQLLPLAFSGDDLP